MQQLGYIQFSTHACTVYQDQDTDLLLLFKQTNRRCDWEIFRDRELAAEYALTPFPSIGYFIRFAEDD